MRSLFLAINKQLLKHYNQQYKAAPQLIYAQPLPDTTPVVVGNPRFVLEIHRKVDGKSSSIPKRRQSSISLSEPQHCPSRL